MLVIARQLDILGVAKGHRWLLGFEGQTHGEESMEDSWSTTRNSTALSV